MVDFWHPLRLECPFDSSRGHWTRGGAFGTFPGMSKPAKAQDLTELPFEEALKKLETIVESMEGDELALDALLNRFEEGTRLARICQSKLAEAELKIQQLEKGASGEAQLKPMDWTDDSPET